jgi:hypothetical protein
VFLFTPIDVPILTTEDVGTVEFHTSGLAVPFAAEVLSFRNSVVAKAGVHTYQSWVSFRDLIMTKEGAMPSPCPTVAFAPVPVYVLILNPAVVFALICPQVLFFVIHQRGIM